MFSLCLHERITGAQAPQLLWNDQPTTSSALQEMFPRMRGSVERQSAVHYESKEKKNAPVFEL